MRCRSPHKTSPSILLLKKGGGKKEVRVTLRDRRENVHARVEGRGGEKTMDWSKKKGARPTCLLSGGENGGWYNADVTILPPFEKRKKHGPSNVRLPGGGKKENDCFPRESTYPFSVRGEGGDGNRLSCRGERNLLGEGGWKAKE